MDPLNPFPSQIGYSYDIQRVENQRQLGVNTLYPRGRPGYRRLTYIRNTFLNLSGPSGQFKLRKYPHY